MIKLITDSTSYIPKEWLKEYDIDVISLSVILGQETIVETKITNEAFFKKINASEFHPTSTQPPVQTVYDVFETYVKKGDSIVACFISSKMSGTYSTAHTVKNMILENYPDAKIEIVDSQSNCMQLGFAVLAGAKAAKAGEPIDAVVKAININIAKSRMLFVPEDIEYLRKSGRLSKAGAIAASLLKIFPVLTVIDGKADVFDKIRTQKKAVDKVVSEVMQDEQSKGIKELLVIHINSMEAAKKLKKRLSDLVDLNIKIGSIGPVIGAHVGPGTIGVVYYTA